LNSTHLEHHPYAGKTVVLTTKHKKLELIAPILESALGVSVVLHEADTDLLGTFVGDVERLNPARQTVIEKARLGTAALGQSLGIASEGTIGPDPSLPFARSDIEYVGFVDLDLGIEVVESYRSMDIVAGEIITEPGADITEILNRVDFPNHKLIVAPHRGERSTAIKGIGDIAELNSSIASLSAKSSDGKVIVQSDLRAHNSPSRQANIRQAALALARRLRALCPECKTPGWGLVGYEKGLDCSSCGELVEHAVRAEIFGCAKCSHKEIGKPISLEADPSICNGCNP
jgi:hypothetical protein